MAESAQDFLFFARNPGTVRVSTRNEKAKAISVICAAWRTATAESRFEDQMIPRTGRKVKGADTYKTKEVWTFTVG